MKTIAFPGADIPDIPRAVALGIFDGVHIGHRAVITRAVGVEGTVSAVFTFEQPPWALPKDAAWELISPDAKNRVLESLGVEELFRADFAAIRHLSPREFVRDVLRGALHARVVSCGFNYHFGKDGAGNADMLRTLCEEYDIQLRLVEPVQVDGLPVSASRIRRFIEQGEVQQAARMLGRPFTIDFPVVGGQKLGRLLGTPTINQPLPPPLYPAEIRRLRRLGGGGRPGNPRGDQCRHPPHRGGRRPPGRNLDRGFQRRSLRPPGAGVSGQIPPPRNQI